MSTDEGWSPGTGAKSTRFAKEEEKLKPFGVPNALPPHGGNGFMKSISYTTDKLSISDKLVTDREWSAGQASLILVKGTVDLDIVTEALAVEGLYPVICRIKGDDKPKALATIWINELRDSVCGAYHEYVISFDVHKTKKDVVAFEPSCMTSPPYACWYNNFGDDVCEAQFLHSLYINSPLSIAWGREMQAFPKHPEPVTSKLDLSSCIKSCEIKWGEDVILKVSTKKRFGLWGFLVQGISLVGHLGLVKVLKFLCHSAFLANIVMPKKTAEQYKRPRDYKGMIWKGLNPGAVQLWSFNPDIDTVELGDVSKATGSEAHNGVALLKKANFTPQAFCFIEKLSAVVSTRDV